MCLTAPAGVKLILLLDVFYGGSVKGRPTVLFAVCRVYVLPRDVYTLLKISVASDQDTCHDGIDSMYVSWL